MQTPYDGRENLILLVPIDAFQGHYFKQLTTYIHTYNVV